MKNSILIYFSLFILVLITIYLVSLNIPYWSFILNHKEVKGKIIEVENFEKGLYKISYSFYSTELKEERTQRISTELEFFVEDTITVMYNTTYPNYIEIKELDSKLNFYRTLVPILVSIVCIVLIIFGINGKFDLNKLS